MDTKLVKIFDAIGELSLSIDILTGFKYGLDHTSFQAKQNAIKHTKKALYIIEGIGLNATAVKPTPTPAGWDMVEPDDLNEMTNFINSCNWDK